MEKKIFNPLEWLEETSYPEIKGEPLKSIEDQANIREIELIIQQIESKQIDITHHYNEWRDIGFALADTFREDGRDYFHRISKFYPDYSVNVCNQQFDNCLKANGHGITLKTFFYHVKQAGIKIKSNSIGEGVSYELPTFPEEIFSQLPGFLQKVVKVATSNEERDILTLGTIAVLSACLPNIFGVYDGKKIYANLYLFITAQASAGKGRLIYCKQIVKPIHHCLRERAKQLKQEFEIEMMAYNAQKSKEGIDKPSKPPEKMLFIPANNSTTGVFQLLSDNEGKGLIFETEGDTLAQAFKSDYGNYSDGFRKAFHHESISYYRRTDREYVDIENPRLSAILSGTPKQVSTLIPNAENGLFSRFIFYSMKIQPIWKDVFAISSDSGLDDYFDQLANDFFKLYETLENNHEVQFCLTRGQQEQFNDFFQQIQKDYIVLKGLDYMASVRRLGIISFRIAMIISALRIMETGDLPNRILCEERDFQASLTIARVLVKHASQIFSQLPTDTPPHQLKNKKQKFQEALPANFNRQTYLKIAESMTIPSKTAEGYISEFVKKGILHREKQDYYQNLSIKEIQDLKEVEKS